MRVEFLEQLQCPAAHAPTPLITVALARHGVHIIDGTLGCATCGARYPLAKGRVTFGDAHLPVTPPPADAPTASGDASGREPDAVLRLAALLDLQHPGQRVALEGALAAHAAALEALTGALVLPVNAPGAGGGIALSRDANWPLADATLDAVAFASAHDLLPGVARVVRVGGRVVAPAAWTLPAACEELARDASHWVARVASAISRPIALQRSAGVRV